MQEKSPGYASRNSFLEFVWCVAAEQNNNNKNSDSSQFYQYILVVRIESLRSYAESSAGKKQIFNENARNLISVVRFLIISDISLQCWVLLIWLTVLQQTENKLIFQLTLQGRLNLFCKQHVTQQIFSLGFINSLLPVTED